MMVIIKEGLHHFTAATASSTIDKFLPYLQKNLPYLQNYLKS